MISTKDINGKPLTGIKYPQRTSIKYILKINIPKGNLRKGLGKGSTPTEILNDKVIVQWERLEYSVHTFPDISTQWNARVSGAETSEGCKIKWPIITYYTESQASFSISRCSGLLFWTPLSGKKWLRTPPSHFIFLGHFRFIKLQSAHSVCAEEGATLSVVVPPWPPLVTQVPSGLALCVHERTWRLVQLCQAADFFFFSRMRDVWGISVLQLSFPQ